MDTLETTADLILGRGGWERIRPPVDVPKRKDARSDERSDGRLGG
jgi:hypothetical protein